MRECLTSLGDVVVTQVGADYNDVIHAAYIEARDILAKQPDTRALDKALLEARIDAANLSYHSDGKTNFNRIIHMEAELAELNKE